MLPIIAKIILVENAERRIFLPREGEILEADFRRFKRPHVKQPVLIEFGRTDGKASGYEVVEMAVSPTERGLQHLVQLGKIEPNWKFEAPGYAGLDANNVCIQANDESVGIKRIKHAAKHALGHYRRQ